VFDASLTLVLIVVFAAAFVLLEAGERRTDP
jgi:hypothetical protein